MYPIKQSTAITVPFFVHDVNGDAVTSLTDGSFTKRISKNGAAFGAMTVTISEMENGWYSIPLSTSHSDTTGILTLVFTNAGAKQTNLQFRVAAKLTDDLNDVAATDIVSSGAITTSAGAVSTVSTLTGHTAQTGDSYAVVNSGTFGNAQLVRATTPANTLDINATGEAGIDLDNTSGTLTSADITSVAGAVLADSSSDAIIADAVWNALTATYGGVGSYGEALEAVDTTSVTVTTNNDKTGYSLTATTGLGNQTANITGNLSGSVGSVTGNVDGNVTGSVGSNLELGPAEVNAEVVDVIFTDTDAEPGQGTPGATISVADKVGYLYKAWRNQSTQTSTEYSLYNDAADTVDQKATVADNATTATKGVVATGP